VTGSDTRHYYYSDQWQVLEERLNSGSGPVLNRQFVWGIRSIDDLVLRDRDTTGNGALNERLYALHDAMSVTAVVNTSGTVQERYGYNGFGQPRYMDGSFGSRSSSIFDWETLFDAYRYDTESGFYQVRFRYLHPGLGRWVSRDPIEFAPANNSHMYLKNSPLTLADSYGLIPFSLLGGIEVPFPNIPFPIEIPWPNIPSDFPWPPKPKLPKIPPLPTSPKHICEGYTPLCKSKCDGKRDPYPVKARKCCKDFMTKYDCADEVQCVAACLIKNEASCQQNDSCKDRKKCRIKAHVDCYSECKFVPTKSIPKSCAAVAVG
jgi:RHS repeat-associated protein